MKKLLFAGAAGLVMCCSPYARGQSIGPSTLNSAGGSTNIGTDTYEWSIGELALVSTFTSSSIVVTQGVLQPVAPTAIDDVSTVAAQLQVYPNPAGEELHLSCTPVADVTLALSLCDMTGRQLYNQSFELRKGVAFSQTIPMASYAAGQYLLSAYPAGGSAAKAAATFHIQKIK